MNKIKLKVALIGKGRIGEVKKPLQSSNAEVYVFNFFFDYLKQKKFDVVVTDSPGSGILKGYILKKIYGIPLLYRMIGNYFQEISSEGKLPRVRKFIAKKFIFNLCDGFMFVNPFLMKVMYNEGLHYKKNYIVWIPKEVNFNIYKDVTLFNLITLTNFRYYEKIKPILKYSKTVDKFLKKVAGKWFIAGSPGKYEELFKEKIKNYENIVYCGYINVDEFFRRNPISVMLHFSEFDATPNAILEGMAAGLPVIVNDYEPLKNIDYVIVVKNEKELEKWLLELHANPALRKRLGIKGQKHVTKQYSLDVVGKKYLKVFKTLQQSSK